MSVTSAAKGLVEYFSYKGQRASLSEVKDALNDVCANYRREVPKGNCWNYYKMRVITDKSSEYSVGVFALRKGQKFYFKVERPMFMGNI